VLLHGGQFGRIAELHAQAASRARESGWAGAQAERGEAKGNAEMDDLAKPKVKRRRAHEKPAANPCLS